MTALCPLAFHASPLPAAADSEARRCVLERAATLIHMKKFNEAQKCLGELNEKDQKASNRLLHASLLKLLSQPVPAPAK